MPRAYTDLDGSRSFSRARNAASRFSIPLSLTQETTSLAGIGLDVGTEM